MKERLTLKRIAKEFNVSIATVSKSLKDSKEISTATKKMIRDYANKHHYQPNSAALSLLNKKTKTIGVIIPNIMNNFFTKVFVGIEQKAAEKGYNLISCISNESYEKEVKTMELLKNGALDGFIVSVAEETQVKENYDHFSNTINEGVPIVMFDRVCEEIHCDKVIVNDLEGAYQATSHLIRTGCKRVALISIIDNLSVGKLRVAGYKKALASFDMALDERLIVKIGAKEDFETTMKIILGDKSIDGLLCLEESSAVRSLKIVKSMGYKVPEEMSIIGFTNGELPKNLTPSISTVSQHGRYIGETAAGILIERLEHKEIYPFETKVVKTSLIERESTKKLL